MDRHLLWAPPGRAADGLACRTTSFRASGGSAGLLCALLVGVALGLSLSTGCGAVPPSVAELVTGEAPTDPTYAGRQHLPVSPDQALEVLRDVATQQGWKVVSTGGEYDTQGQRGTFFRLAPTTPGGEQQTVSGVFYAEPSGSYVRISQQNGLPEALVEPLITEIKKQKGDR